LSTSVRRAKPGPTIVDFELYRLTDREHLDPAPDLWIAERGWIEVLRLS
jgi:hypothetical protein